MAHNKHGHGAEGGHQHGGGMVLDRGWRYDLEVWFFDTFAVGGKISDLRREVLQLAQLPDARSLLDVGCGTGSLAIQAAGRLTRTGRVAGVDPAPRQLARARSKARRAGVEVDFRQGSIEQLPFPDGSFEAVTSTLMMHHLPPELKQQGLAEIRRVLRPGGRLVVADFDYADDPAEGGQPEADGYAGAGSLPALLEEAGFTVVQRAQISFPRTHRGWSGAQALAATRP